MMKERPGRGFEGLSSVPQQLDLWERRGLEDCRQALHKARDIVNGHEPYADRVEFVARGFRFTDAMLEEYWQARRVSEQAVDVRTSGNDLLAGLRKLLRRAHTREKVWDEIRDDPLVSSIYRLLFTQYSSRLATWRSYLKSSTTTGLSALAGRPDVRLDELRAALPGLVNERPAGDVAALTTP